MVASAQIYVGGSLGFWNNDDAEEMSYSICPEVGYTLSDNLALGAVLGYDYSEQGDFDTKSIKVSPYARYTFLKAGAVSLFADGAVDLLFGDDDQKAWSVGVKPGIAVAINENFSAVAHVGYLGYGDNEDGLGDAIKHGFGLNLKNSLSFGLYYSF